MSAAASPARHPCTRRRFVVSVLARHLGQTGRWTGDHGQGLETTLAQVVADELGARIDGIGILQSDNTVVAHGTGINASRTRFWPAEWPPWRRGCSRKG
jgi:CO/xanthine dehydrogenase Mo-binding subunit